MNTVSKKQPRAIRSVVKWTGKQSKRVPKMARDRKTGHTAERIKAMQPRPCASVACPWPNNIGHSRHGIIAAGTHYIRVSDPRIAKRINKSMVPLTADYHPDCVPKEDRPLVRILVGFRWIAETCVNGAAMPVSYRKFTSVDAWAAWVDKEYPSFRKKWDYTSNEAFQVGTGYNWSTLTRYHGRLS